MPAMTIRKPNFLFVISDQHRWDHVGYSGNRIVRTPNIDALAANGSWFERFFVSSPTCMSNRATLMTGRMPSQHGVLHNGIPLDLDAVTFVDLFKAAGYRTGLIGKCHLQGMALEPPRFTSWSPDPAAQPPPADLAEARRSRYGRDDYAFEFIDLWKQNPGRRPTDVGSYYGFEHVELCSGHGDNVSGHYEQWLLDRAPEVASRRGRDGAVELGRSGHPQIYRSAVPEEVYPTRYILERSAAYLEAAAADGQPFFLQCSFPDPHHPFTPPGRYWDMYDPDEIDLPATFNEPNRASVPPVERLWGEFEAGRKPGRWTYPFIADEAQAREMIAKTYGQITMIDDAVGELVSRLEVLGLADNTIVCFMSDHGDYLGDHRLFLKGPMHYQGVIRTPFVWKDCDPAFASGSIGSPHSTLDIAPTLLARAGLQPFNGMQGQSFLAEMSEPGGADTSDDVLIEQVTQYAYLGFDGPISVHTLISGPWRLSIWQDQTWGELYDLANDPDERTNLWDEPAHDTVRGALMQRLIHAIQRSRDASPAPLTVS